jgi:hypothetical protein
MFYDILAVIDENVIEHILELALRGDISIFGNDLF